MYIVGIDIAKRFHEAAIIDSSGKVIIKRIRFANSHTGFLKLMEAVRKLDALIVAEVIRFGRYCETQVAPENIVALRELCRQRFFVVDTASDFKRKIIALLDQTFPEYEKLFSDTFGKSSVELLANYSTPEEMLSVDAQKLADILNKASRGRLGLEKANRIQQTAKNSFGIVLASSSFSLIIRQYSEQLKSLESSIAAFDSEIARLMDNFNTKLETILPCPSLSLMPGFILNRVNRANQNLMGESARLTLDELFGLPLPSPLSKTPLSVFSTRRNEDHLTAIGHVCHKMLAIIFAVLRDNKPYVPASAS